MIRTTAVLRHECNVWEGMACQIYWRNVFVITLNMQHSLDTLLECQHLGLTQNTRYVKSKRKHHPNTLCPRIFDHTKNNDPNFCYHVISCLSGLRKHILLRCLAVYICVFLQGHHVGNRCGEEREGVSCYQTKEQRSLYSTPLSYHIRQCLLLHYRTEWYILTFMKCKQAFFLTFRRPG